MADRLTIVQSIKTNRDLAEQYGVHQSRISQIRQDAMDILENTWDQRKLGRKPKPKISEELTQNKSDLQDLKHEFELLTMRNEWLELQVEIEKKRTDEAAREAKKRKKKRLRRNKK